MRKIDLELAVGFFMLVGIAALVYLSVRLGRLEVIGTQGYTVYASFEQNGGIRSGSPVEIAGVDIGKVKSIRLDPNYQAVLELTIRKEVKLQDDAIASVKTRGLIGEKFIQITPGSSDDLIPDRGRITDTESAIDFEALISKYIFGKV